MIETLLFIVAICFVCGALVACGVIIGAQLTARLVDDYRERLAFYDDMHQLRLMREERFDREQDERERGLLDMQALYDEIAITNGELRVCAECVGGCDSDEDDDDDDSDIDPIDTMRADAGRNGYSGD